MSWKIFDVGLKIQTHLQGKQQPKNFIRHTSLLVWEVKPWFQIRIRPQNDRIIPESRVFCVHLRVIHRPESVEQQISLIPAS